MLLLLVSEYIKRGARMKKRVFKRVFSVMVVVGLLALVMSIVPPLRVVSDLKEGDVAYIPYPEDIEYKGDQPVIWEDTIIVEKASGDHIVRLDRDENGYWLTETKKGLVTNPRHRIIMKK